MNRTSSPGIGQWFTVSIMVAISLFLIIKLYQYAGFRQYYPAGLTVAGVDVGGLTREEAGELLTNRYVDAPVVIYHGENPVEISPSQVKFTLDRETMLSQADYQRSQQDFWAGFWGFLWGRPIEVEPVPLSATHDREALGGVLEQIAVLSDEPSQPPQPVPDSLSFQYGAAGIETNIEASFSDVEAALYRPSSREAHLVVERGEPLRPELNLLTRLIVNHLQDFSQINNGVASVFILDLQTGEEVAVNADLAMSAMDLMKVPIVEEIYRTMDRPPTLAQQALISETLVANVDHTSANALLNIIAGTDDPYRGAETVTESLQRLGLQNSFMAAPYDAEARKTIATPANQAEGLPTLPTREMQTTAEEMGILLSMIYYCAEGQGGTLTAVYEDQLTQEECQTLLDYMLRNKIDGLLEEGAPPDTPIAHRHGWINDTHGDAAIIYSPAGDYVVVVMLYKPDWLEWEISSPLIADISRAAYNYFNFDTPYLGNGAGG